MRVCIAADSFKGTYSSLEVADLIAAGIRRVYPRAEIDKLPVADGGEGTLAALAGDAKRLSLTVRDPIGRPVQASYAIGADGTAFIEMAQASGLCLLSEAERAPLAASTYGTGELILDALNRGCTRLIIGLGGSATTDGGTGMAAALGVRFSDSDGRPLPPGGDALRRLAEIDCSGLDPRLQKVDVLAACDVENPLCGPTGAAAVYAPQKGADAKAVARLEQGLQRFADVCTVRFGRNIQTLPGAGAAGGAGAGLVLFCGAKLVRGIDLILDNAGTAERMQAADVIVTGEGRTDGQTAFGKVVAGVAARGRAYKKPVFAVSGSVCSSELAAVYAAGLDAAVSCVTAPMTLEEVIANSAQLIPDAAERLFRIILAMRR